MGVTGSTGSALTRRALRSGPAAPGAKLWVERYGLGNGFDSASALVVSPNGSRVFVAGQSLASKGWDSSDYATFAYDTSTGTKLWVTRYNGPANGYDSGDALGVSPDGSTVFVTGNSATSTNSSDYATLAYGAT